MSVNKFFGSCVISSSLFNTKLSNCDQCDPSTLIVECRYTTNKYCFGPKTHAHPFILRRRIVVHGTGWLRETSSTRSPGMHRITWSIRLWQISAFTAHRGNNVYIPRKYGGGIRLCMAFMLQEPGMPTRSFLKRFVPFSLHNRHNLEFAVEQTCAEISYYPQFRS